MLHCSSPRIGERGSAVVDFVLLVVPMMICLQAVLFLAFEYAAQVEAIKLAITLSRQSASADFDPSQDLAGVEDLDHRLQFSRPVRINFRSLPRDFEVCLDYSTVYKTSHVCWTSFKESRP